MSAGPNRVGRPRLRASAADRAPREEILARASQLFAERGVAATTMRGIAEAAGLQQSSLYYYFTSKEAILATVISEANRFTLDHLRRLERERCDPALALHRLVRFDVLVLCSLPYDITEVSRLAESLDPTIGDYWKDRSALHRGVERILAKGIADGVFRDVDPTLTALAVLSDDEATQLWFRGVAVDRLVMGAERRRQLTGEAVAEHRAELTSAGLLRDRRRLDAIAAAARVADPVESIEEQCSRTIGRLADSRPPRS